MISGLKYVIIVKYEKVRYFREDKVKQLFFWLSIIYPFYILAIFNIVRPDFLTAFEGISQANRCLGKSDMSSMADTNETTSNFYSMFKMCESDAPQNQIYLEYMVYLGRKAICWLHLILAFSNAWNIPELFIYYNIFSFMRR